MKSFVDRGSIAGAVTLIAQRGKVISVKAVGYQDIGGGKPMKTDTIFDVRSMTKPVTAIGIMILVEEGQLAINDPVEKYLPEFKATPFKAQDQPKPITIRHLLTHTSGVPGGTIPGLDEYLVKRHLTLAEIAALFSKHEPDFEPGTQYRYGTGFGLLGRIIEVVSGEAYDQFIEARILKPLGMKDSFFFPPDEKNGRIASIYKREDGKLKKWEEIEAYRGKAKSPGPDFGMYSTASDLAALCQMMLNGGTLNGKRILSESSVEEMTRLQTMNVKSAVTQRPVYYGLGWGLTVDARDAFPSSEMGSYGHNGAFGTIMWIDPKRELIRIFLAQQFGIGNEVDIFMAMAGSSVNG